MHQPNHLPWLGYFHKMVFSDVFVFLDSVQYTPKTYTNRCLISNGGKEVRLSVPVSLESWDTAITGVQIDTRKFAHKHLESFRHAYGKCKAFDTIMDVIRPHYEIGVSNLAEFNIGLIKSLAAYFDLTPSFVRLSELGIESQKNSLLIDVAQACGADIFVSGVGAKDYISGHENEYTGAGVRLAYQNFVHPQYRQRFPNFVKGCSIIDLAFNAGDSASEIISAQAEPNFVEWQPEDS